jgi:hypothetical protein
MKVWPIDPLVPRNLRLEVPEKLPQGWKAAPKSVLRFKPFIVKWREALSIDYIHTYISTSLAEYRKLSQVRPTLYSTGVGSPKVTGGPFGSGETPGCWELSLGLRYQPKKG